MGKLFDKRWVGDQLVAVVGLLVAAAMAALLGVVVLVAGRVDEDASARERDLMLAAVLALKSKVKNDLASIAPPDSVFDLSQDVHARWLHRYFGAPLYRPAATTDPIFSIRTANRSTPRLAASSCRAPESRSIPR
jgi:hypothetical protein